MKLVFLCVCCHVVGCHTDKALERDPGDTGGANSEHDFDPEIQ